MNETKTSPSAQGSLSFKQQFNLVYNDENREGQPTTEETIEIHGEIQKHFDSFRTKVWVPNKALNKRQKELLGLEDFASNGRNHNDEYLLKHDSNGPVLFLDAVLHFHQWCNNSTIKKLLETAEESAVASSSGSSSEKVE